MPKGRPPKPRNMKILAGTFRPDRANVHEPIPDVAIPPPPDGLSDEALAEWKRITPELARLGLISQLDLAALAGYCESYAAWRQAESMLVEHGHTTYDNNGVERQSPWVRIRSDCRKAMLDFLREFGLSPASRAKCVANKAAAGPSGIKPRQRA